jgi:hypothetical protein
MNIESVQKKHEDELMRLPNVRAVGICEKDGKEALAVYVTHKVLKTSLKRHERIPENLGGYPVVVLELGGEVDAQNKVVDVQAE